MIYGKLMSLWIVALVSRYLYWKHCKKFEVNLYYSLLWLKKNIQKMRTWHISSTYSLILWKQTLYSQQMLALPMNCANNIQLRWGKKNHNCEYIFHPELGKHIYYWRRLSAEHRYLTWRRGGGDFDVVSFTVLLSFNEIPALADHSQPRWYARLTFSVQVQWLDFFFFFLLIEQNHKFKGQLRSLYSTSTQQLNKYNF